MKFLIAVFLPASLFIPTSPFINFGDFCQRPRLLHSPFIILAEICQPSRLFRPPLLFETPEYCHSETFSNSNNVSLQYTS